MSIMCDKDCKEGIPIPFIGYLCSGVCGLLRPTFNDSAIQESPRANDLSHQGNQKHTEQRSNTCGCEGCSK